ncbi:RNA polymerase rpc34 subunit containing protein [Babesia ovata]|uniref:RNA polymerase rpc34 subunit containing protein n=1 Tax=Babesia ovata TaxID=189622 RepID=A0A2H6KB62_9APIC|nr:RNA polymerase rpc34 subunit containing protein [Babesia ovata]GBE60228.1 RNA polymerase rpc34 subunit containing protein [Babesia ovata]
MSRSTNSLIAEQCYLINRDTPRPQNSKRKVHSILSNQISSLNNSDSLLLNDQASEQPPVEETSNARGEGARRPATRPQKRPSSAQTKSSNNSFIQLLTGDAVSDAATSMSAQSREEAELVYKLCVENDGIFTEEIFGRHIAKFRHSIQHGLVSNSVDFLNFLKLLKGSRQYSFHHDDDGKKYVRLRDKESREQVARLQDVEYAVFCTIETAGNRGIWTADIKKLCEITVRVDTACHQRAQGNQLTRTLKVLVEQHGLVKQVTNVHQKSRKLYMLFNIKPARELTGGSFYLNGEFNEMLVEHIQEQVGSFLAKFQGSSLTQITNFLKTLENISGEVREEDVLSIIQILMLEDKVYSAPTALGDTIYIVSQNYSLARAIFAKLTLYAVVWKRYPQLCSESFRHAVFQV